MLYPPHIELESGVKSWQVGNKIRLDDGQVIQIAQITIEELPDQSIRVQFWAPDKKCILYMPLQPR